MSAPGTSREELRSINPNRPARAAGSETASGNNSSSSSGGGGTRYKSYTIRPGDNFHTLAKRLYGAERFWTDIAQANPSVDPVRLKVGQVIRLPVSGDDQHTGDGTATGATASGSAAGAGTMSERASGAGGGGVTSSAGSAESASSSGATRHTVRSGETLSTIAKKYYGSVNKWELILRANRDQLSDPRDLQPGMTLVIPAPR